MIPTCQDASRSLIRVVLPGSRSGNACLLAWLWDGVSKVLGRRILSRIAAAMGYVSLVGAMVLLPTQRTDLEARQD